MSSNERYMYYALSLARKGYGTVFPNPPVGAVIVKEGKIVSAAYHTLAGSAHAERKAIDSAFKEDLVGACMYVTLEPCTHYGKTAPCTDAIFHAGISEVVYGATDLHSEASGGAMLLSQKGLSVFRSSLSEMCMDFLEPWHRWILHRQKSLDVFMVLSLNGLLCRDLTMNPQSFFYNQSTFRFGRSVQRVVSTVSEIENTPSYHLGYVGGTPDRITEALQSPFLRRVFILRVPEFRVEDDRWGFWEANVSLKRQDVRKFGTKFLETYTRE